MIFGTCYTDPRRFTSGFMLTVTDSAKEELQRTLERTSLAPGKVLRLTTPPAWTGPGDFGVVIDASGEDEHLVEFHGATVLVVDSDLADHLTDSVLDFIDSSDGPRFTLDVY